MSADPLIAIDYVLANEGGYVDNPADPGGETNFGISKRAYPALNIKELTRQDAVTIYERDYWKFDGVQSQRAATKILDMAVDLGPHEATLLLQTSLNDLGVHVAVDGAWGPETLEAANTAIAQSEDKFIDELKARLAYFYCNTPPNEHGELFGWLRRAVKG